MNWEQNGAQVTPQTWEVKVDTTVTTETKTDWVVSTTTPSVEENYKKAMYAERQEKEDLKKQLADLADFKKKAEEDKMKEKGQLKELLTQKETELASAAEKAKLWDKYVEENKNKLSQELTDLESKLTSDVKTKYSSIIDKLDLESKVMFYKTLSNDIKKPDFNGSPSNNWEQLKSQTEYEKAVAAWDIKGMLKYAPPKNVQK